MALTKGFLTIATGKEQYYEIAKNLLLSYRFTTKEPLPFTILCDTENEYTKFFDEVRIFTEPTRSYLDKLNMFDLLPYDINIFIDADCLCFGDINRLFDIFENADDFCCYGRVLPLDDKTGWFEYDNLNEALQKQIDYVVGLHGGIYYIRKTQKAKKVLDDAKAFTKNYTAYKFKGKFETPGDEPVVALSMAVNGCKPIPHDFSSLICWWEHENLFDLDIINKSAYCRPLNTKTDIVHWGTRFTKSIPYLKEMAALMLNLQGASEKEIKKSNKYYDKLLAKEKANQFKTRVINKINRTLNKS
ncbi:MAG: hypothetical protein IKT55_08065 [Clostridia bacterium]|nr:hypothetical protein [Clostridia bacterium]